MARLTIAVLSWGYHETLINTLTSYQEFGLDKLSEDKVIFFQEYSKKDREIAKEFGYDAFGSPENIGIAEAYKLLAAYASGEFFLFLENDWKLIESAERAILGGQELLASGVDIIRYRHRKNPGNPLWTRQFQGREYDRPTHLLDCVHWEDSPEKFKEISPVFNQSDKWYITSSKNANWTNNPHMAKSEFIYENVMPHLDGGDLERDIQSWWEQQNFLVAQGTGLFTHERTN